MAWPCIAVPVTPSGSAPSASSACAGSTGVGSPIAPAFATRATAKQAGSDSMPGNEAISKAERSSGLAVVDAARSVARIRVGDRNPNVAVGLVGVNEPLDASRLQAHCHARSWKLRLTVLPQSPTGRRAALGRILVTARRTRAQWLVATGPTLAFVESDHDGSWRALADLLDRLGVSVVAI